MFHVVSFQSGARWRIRPTDDGVVAPERDTMRWRQVILFMVVLGLNLYCPGHGWADAG